jgi:DNA-binding LytR/AlgR family response regulator
LFFFGSEEIDWIELADYYVELHVGARTYLYRESMAALEARLDPARFVRIHRTAIVNRRVLRSGSRSGRSWSSCRRTSRSSRSVRPGGYEAGWTSRPRP